LPAALALPVRHDRSSLLPVHPCVARVIRIVVRHRPSTLLLALFRAVRSYGLQR
jgi:hypothetical protein